MCFLELQAPRCSRTFLWSPGERVRVWPRSGGQDPVQPRGADLGVRWERPGVQRDQL